MKQSVVICAAREDAGQAAEIRRYVEANCSHVRFLEDAVVGSAAELLDTVESALGAQIVLLLLSPASVPARWSRAEWERVLFTMPHEENSALAFILVRECRYPAQFQKHKLFFDLTGDLKAGLRKLRRWLMEQNPMRIERAAVLPPRGDTKEEEGALDELLDSAGSAFDVPESVALGFAHAHEPDFEGTFWLGCEGRGAAGVVGDTGRALGLRLKGDLAQNREALREIAGQERYLFVFAGLGAGMREWAEFGGRASVIFTACPNEPKPYSPLGETLELFSHWRRNSERCLDCLRDAEHHLEGLASRESSLDLEKLGAAVAQLLLQQERLAEAYAVIETLSRRAWDDCDGLMFRRWENEMRWIREAWGNPTTAAPRLGGEVAAKQTSFDFS